LPSFARRDNRSRLPGVVYETDRGDRALALVAAGLGVALLPGHFEFPAVKHVPVSDLGICRTVGLLWLREREDAGLKDLILAVCPIKCRD
jgi:DNA-binding transcriptional LysR family regulator